MKSHCKHVISIWALTFCNCFVMQMFSVDCYVLIIHYLQKPVSICPIVTPDFNWIQIRFLVLLTCLLKHCE